MTPEILLNGNIELYAGDMLAVLPTLPENSVDSVVCDPPYHLTSIVKRFGSKNAAPAKGNQAFVRASKGFMNQTWDGGDIAFDPDTWLAVLRVLKPGGHMVAFSGTRTYHRMACAIEDAGFEIRDSLQWLYGSGFPKSHDVSKGIQKRRTEDEEPVRVICRAIRAAMDAREIKSRHLVERFDNCHPRLIDHWAARDTDSQPTLPTWTQWLTLKSSLGMLDDLDPEVWRLNGRKGTPGGAWSEAEILGEREGVAPGLVGLRFNGDNTIRVPTDDAAEWQGWGTALKPACEPIVLARKPLSEKTVASNVLKWGTGALNIDGCRIEGEPTHGSGVSQSDNAITAFGDLGTKRVGVPNIINTSGRWPANLIHDGSEEVLAGFPESAGQQGDVRGSEQSHTGDDNTVCYGEFGRVPFGKRSDSGSAARFFYTAKADQDDRIGSKHPTVKPVDLMQWLVRLVTPRGGTCLDPFAGTGTTGEAAFREGCKAILIEREEEYQEDIRRRMVLVMSGRSERKRESIKARKSEVDAGPLFGFPMTDDTESKHSPSLEPTTNPDTQKGRPGDSQMSITPTSVQDDVSENGTPVRPSLEGEPASVVVTGVGSPSSSGVLV